MFITLDSDYGGTQLECDAKRNEFLHSIHVGLTEIAKENSFELTIRGEEARKYIDWSHTNKEIQALVELLVKEVSDLYDEDLLTRPKVTKLFDITNKIKNLTK